MDTQSIGISESRMFMWRAVVAMVHADEQVMPQEKSFVENILQEETFSEEQRQALIQDLMNPNTCSKMFTRIKDAHDIEDYFVYARSISWCDGDFSCQEKKIISKLDSLYEDECAMNLLHHSRDLLEEVTLDCPDWEKKKENRVTCFKTLMHQLITNNSKYHYYDDECAQRRESNG